MNRGEVKRKVFHMGIVQEQRGAAWRGATWRGAVRHGAVRHSEHTEDLQALKGRPSESLYLSILYGPVGLIINLIKYWPWSRKHHVARWFFFKSHSHGHSPFQAAPPELKKIYPSTRQYLEPFPVMALWLMVLRHPHPTKPWHDIGICGKENSVKGRKKERSCYRPLTGMSSLKSDSVPNLLWYSMSSLSVAIW